MTRIIGIFIVVALLVSALACQAAEPSQETIDRTVDSMLEHPTYLASLEMTEEDWEQRVNAEMQHPAYVAYLEAETVTPYEQCVMTMVGALGSFAIDQELTSDDFPTDDETEAICEWFVEQIAET